MFQADVDWTICQACDPCSARLVCKTRAVVKVDADEPALIDPARCHGCGDCLPACPYSAISLASPRVPNGPTDESSPSETSLSQRRSFHLRDRSPRFPFLRLNALQIQAGAGTTQAASLLHTGFTQHRLNQT